MIGADFRMRDAEARVVGTVAFTLDHSVPGMVHAATLRSPLPHARIVAVDTAAARQAPGVLAVLTGADLDADPGVEPYFGQQRADQPVLAIGTARYAGDPVALVVAETQEQARAAVALVEVDYEELPAVTDPVAAGRGGAPVIHQQWPDNDCGSWRLHLGDVEEGWRQSERVYDDVYTSPPASHVTMEPFVSVAEWAADGQLLVWTSAQAPHAVHRALRRMFGLADDQVRVRVFNLGGGYGAKGQIRIEPLVACAARAVGRPVRLELTREETFQTVAKHAASVRIRTGVTLDGRLVARDVQVVYNAGAYAFSSPGATGQALTRAPGPYHLPHCRVEVVARYTNTVPTGPFRGAMTSQLAWAYESQLDDIAADLGIDPVELRRRNVLRDGQVYATGEALHDLHYLELLEDAAAAVGWGVPSEPAPPGRVRGKGVAVMIKNTVTPSRSEARLEALPDGRILIHCSSVEMGQGAGATMLQITADELGVDPDRLELGFPDTQVTPFDTTTSSSRSTGAMGSALTDAAGRLRGDLADLAAKQLAVAPGELDHERGAVVVRDDPARRKPYGAVVADAGLDRLVAEGVFATDFGLRYMDPQDVRGPVSNHWHQGAAAAEVEVDLDTGQIRVLHLHAGCYAGRVVSPLRVRQQNQGCLVYALGPTLFEELLVEDGQTVNTNLSDYMIPSILDVPEALTSTAIEHHAAGAELHGVGEMALPAVAPAIANALFHATGVRVRDLPLTPERVLRALLAAAADAADAAGGADPAGGRPPAPPVSSPPDPPTVRPRGASSDTPTDTPDDKL